MLRCAAQVCLAVWQATASDDLPGKFLAIVMTIAAFVAMGFEHSGILPNRLLSRQNDVDTFSEDQLFTVSFSTYALQ